MAKGDFQFALKTKNGGPEFFVFDGTWQEVNPTNVAGWTKNAWHSLTATCSSTSLSLYLDGKLIGVNNRSSNIATVDFSLGIGKYTDPNYASRSLRGTMGAARAYTRALSATEVLNQYNADVAHTGASGASGSGVLFWYDMNGYNIPAAPTGLTAAPVSAAGAADGGITGITSAMECRAANETAYTPCTGNLTGLSAGTYYVRFAAAGDNPAPLDAAVVVKTTVSVGPTGLTAIPASDEGAADGGINGATAAMEYRADGSSAYIPCTVNLTGLTGGTYYVRFAATADSTASPDTAVTVLIAPGAPDGLEAVPASTAGAADGSITGTTAAMEYRADGSETYIPCTGDITGLAAGVYYVRYVATADTPASRDTVLTVGVKTQKWDLGDVNHDGSINTVDVRMILQRIVNKLGDGDLDMSLADVSGDGKVDTVDARLILQYIVHKINAFPGQ